MTRLIQSEGLDIMLTYPCNSDHCNPTSILLRHVMRKTVFGVSDQVRHKPVCKATEDGYRLEIFGFIVFSVQRKQRR